MIFMTVLLCVSKMHSHIFEFMGCS